MYWCSQTKGTEQERKRRSSCYALWASGETSVPSKELATELHSQKKKCTAKSHSVNNGKQSHFWEQTLLISGEIYYKIIDISENKSTSFGSQGSPILYFQGYGNAKVPLFTILTLTSISEKVQLSHLAANQLCSLPGFHNVWPFPPTWNNCSYWKYHSLPWVQCWGQPSSSLQRIGLLFHITLLWS